jgi:hypothetical protein
MKVVSEMSTDISRNLSPTLVIIDFELCIENNDLHKALRLSPVDKTLL